jgi:hypothetical protein
LKAIITNWKDKDDKEKQFLEIWNNTSRIESLNLSKINKHSKVYEPSGNKQQYL